MINIATMNEMDRDRLLTRLGQEVHIYKTDGEGAYPIRGVVMRDDDLDFVGWWDTGGRYVLHNPGSRGFDLTLPARKINRSFGLSISPSGVSVHSGVLIAGASGPARRQSCEAVISIDLSDIEEGDGLDGNYHTYRLVRVDGK